MEFTKFEFSERELSAMQEVSSRTDISTDRGIYSYGSSGQAALMQLLESVCTMAQTRDGGSLQVPIEEAEAALRRFRTEEKLERRLFGLLRKKQDQEAVLRQKIDTAALAVDVLAEKLERRHLDLMKNLELLSQKETDAQNCYRMLCMYIRAGKMKLEREQGTTLANLREIAKRTNLKQDIASAENFERCCRRFELKLRDLANTADICSNLIPLVQELKNIDHAFSQTVHCALVGEVSRWKQSLCTEELSEALTQILAAQEQNLSRRRAVSAEVARLLEHLRQKGAEVV